MSGTDRKDIMQIKDSTKFLAQNCMHKRCSTVLCSLQTGYDNNNQCFCSPQSIRHFITSEYLYRSQWKGMLFLIEFATVIQCRCSAAVIEANLRDGLTIVRMDMLCANRVCAALVIVLCKTIRQLAEQFRRDSGKVGIWDE